MAKNDDNIVLVFNELKEKALILPKRKIKSSKVVQNFKAGLLFNNTIFYNPKLSAMNTNNIRFALLHEEGHQIKHQYGTPGVILFMFLALLPILINWILSGNNVILSITIVCYSLMFVFSAIKIFNDPLRWDEFESDIYAATILRDHFDIKKPSEILFNTLNEIYTKLKSNENEDESIVYRIFIGLFSYHPSIEERVKKVKTFVDER